MKLFVATTNPSKLREFALAGLVAEPLPACGAPDESGATFEENAIRKAQHYSQQFAGVVLAEDSGLEVLALGGAPGVRSARWAGNDEANNARLREAMRGQADRRARYVSVIAAATGGQLLAVFRGEVEGEILDHPRGTGGFGYDPLFYYPPFGATFAEVDATRKWEVSHRRRALDQLLAWLKKRRQAR